MRTTVLESSRTTLEKKGTVDGPPILIIIGIIVVLAIIVAAVILLLMMKKKVKEVATEGTEVDDILTKSETVPPQPEQAPEDQVEE